MPFMRASMKARSRNRLEIKDLSDRNEAQFARIIESLGVGIGLSDPSEKILLANSKLCSMLGFSKQELIGSSVSDLIVFPQDRDLMLKMTARRMQGISEDYEIRFIRKNGSVFWAKVSATPITDSHGNVTASLASISDITQQKNALEEVKRTEDLLRAIVEGTASVTAENFFRSLVKHLAQVLGTKVAFIGKVSERSPGVVHVLALWLQDHFEPPEKLDYHVIDTPSESVIGQEMKIYLEGVSQRFPKDPFLVNNKIESYMGIPLFDSTGKALGILAVMHDQRIDDLPNYRSLINIFAARAGAEIERLQAEREKEELLKAFTQSQKMQAIGQLPAGLAHDLNNSLGAIMGHLQLMKVKSHLPPDLTKSIDICLKGCERSSTLIEQLLAFSRQGKYQLKILNLRQVVEEALEFLGRVISQNVLIEAALHNEALYVQADENQLQQVIANLIINSQQAMPDGGEIRLSIGSKYVSQPQRFNLAAKAGRYVFLSVKDTGIGIPAQDLEKIFDPFFTTKAESGGSGLGLSMVYGVMQNHGGWIQVESNIHQGARFDLYFPEAQAPSLEVTKESTQTLQISPGVIMVVDDEPFLVELSRKFLELAGFKCFGFSDPREAVQWYEKNSTQVDLVVLDMKMPHLDGKQCFSRFRQINPQARIVMLCGYIQDEDATQLLEQGALELFHKPLRYPELISWISTTVSKQRSQA